MAEFGIPSSKLENVNPEMRREKIFRKTMIDFSKRIKGHLVFCIWRFKGVCCCSAKILRSLLLEGGKMKINKREIFNKQKGDAQKESNKFAAKRIR